jgi:hypothetical protein
VAITFSEQLLSLAEAARKIPSIKKSGTIHPSAITRWIHQGVLTKSGNRVKLEALKVGQGYFTSAEALDRFFAEVGDNQSSPSDPNPSPKSKRSTPANRKKRAEAAGRELENLGA